MNPTVAVVAALAALWVWLGLRRSTRRRAARTVTTIGRGVWAAARWTARGVAVVGLAVGAFLIAATAALFSSRDLRPRTRDDRRLYTAEERRRIGARAGWRCEHVANGERCTHAGDARWMHAHHVIPWAAGGRTTLDNAAWYCSLHNGRVGDRMPTRAELDALYRSRAGYMRRPPVVRLPDDVEMHVA